MIYKFNGKDIKIPDDDIENYMKNLDLTRDEAIETWLDDEGYTENVEVEELTAKAKENHTNIIHAQTDIRQRKKREVAPKEDKVKEDIVAAIARLMEAYGTDIKVTNKTKYVEFKGSDGEFYKIDLIRRRKKD